MISKYSLLVHCLASVSIHESPFLYRSKKCQGVSDNPSRLIRIDLPTEQLTGAPFGPPWRVDSAVAISIG